MSNQHEEMTLDGEYFKNTVEKLCFAYDIHVEKIATLPICSAFNSSAGGPIEITGFINISTNELSKEITCKDDLIRFTMTTRVGPDIRVFTNVSDNEGFVATLTHKNRYATFKHDTPLYTFFIRNLNVSIDKYLCKYNKVVTRPPDIVVAGLLKKLKYDLATEITCKRELYDCGVDEKVCIRCDYNVLSEKVPKWLFKENKSASNLTNEAGIIIIKCSFTFDVTDGVELDLRRSNIGVSFMFTNHLSTRTYSTVHDLGDDMVALCKKLSAFGAYSLRTHLFTKCLQANVE